MVLDVLNAAQAGRCTWLRSDLTILADRRVIFNRVA